MRLSGVYRHASKNVIQDRARVFTTINVVAISDSVVLELFFSRQESRTDRIAKGTNHGEAHASAGDQKKSQIVF
jgi:hypothetical protein